MQIGMGQLECSHNALHLGNPGPVTYSTQSEEILLTQVKHYQREFGSITYTISI